MLDTWGRQALNLLVFLLLARLLDPEDFGLVALAMVFVSFAQVVVDQGLGDALIQRGSITRSHIDTAFWVAVATATLLTVVALVLAGPLAAWIGEPDFAPVLRVLSLTFVLSALSSIQIAILRRGLAFRSLAIRSILATAGGGAVGVTMAFLGYGAWSLVGQQVAIAVLSVTTMWFVTPWRPGLEFSGERFRELFRFGINVMGSDVLSFISRNSDNLLIGVVLGTTALGFYAVGYRILDTSQTVLIQVTRKLAFPVFSRLQHDSDRLRRAYLRLTRAAGAIILPGYIALAIVGQELVVVLFGSQWSTAGTVATILFLIGPALSLQAFSNALLNASGHPNVVLRFRLIATVTNVVGFLIAVPFGITAVAAAFVIRAYLLLPLLLVWLRRYAQIPPRDYLMQQVPTAASTMVMALTMLAARMLLDDVAPIALLLVELGIGMVVYSAAIWLLGRDVVRDLSIARREMLRGFAPPWRARRGASITD